MAEKFIALISPAKRIESGVSGKVKEFTRGDFMDEAEYLANKLKKYSAKKISGLMNVSAEIGELNQQRYAEWTPDFTPEIADASILTFKGDVYRGMGAEDFNAKELKIAQDKIRILSGLYGVLRPLDMMMPYRLEMGTRMQVTPKTKNLYQYWKNKIAENIEDQLGSDGVLLNLASNEYIKAVPAKAMKNRRIEFKFLDLKNGEYKSIMTYNKLARGYMCRFIVKNNIQDFRDLRGFDSKNYVFSDALSSENEMVFTRDVVEL